MYTGDESDRSFGAFVLISLILHAMLFLSFPAGNLRLDPAFLQVLAAVLFLLYP